MSPTAVTVIAWLCVLIGIVFIVGAAWQASLPQSPHSSSYADCGTRDTQQIVLWFIIGIAIIVVGLDYALTGGEHAREFWRNLP